MANPGATPIDYTTPVGQFRALVGDTESVALDPPVAGEGDYAWFGDDQIEGLLSVYGDSVKRAAAQANRLIASSQALLLKKWSADDLSVDGAAIAEALRKLAKDLDWQADAEEAGLDFFVLSYPKQCEIHAELSPFIYGVQYGLTPICDC